MQLFDLLDALRNALIVYVYVSCGGDTQAIFRIYGDGYGDDSFHGLLDRLDTNAPESYMARTPEQAIEYFNKGVARAKTFIKTL